MAIKTTGLTAAQKELRKKVRSRTGNIPQIGFPFGKDKIDPNELNRQIALWSHKERLKNPDDTVRLFGFSSRPGGSGPNWVLSKRRVIFVYKHLISIGTSCKFMLYACGEEIWKVRDRIKRKGVAAENYDHPLDRCVGVAFSENDFNNIIKEIGGSIKFPKPTIPKKPDTNKELGKAFLKYLKELAKSLAQGQGAPVPGPGFGVELGKEYLKSVGEKNKAMAIISFRTGIILGIEAANVIVTHSSPLNKNSFSGIELRNRIERTPRIKQQITRKIGPLVRTFKQWEEFYLLGIERIGKLLTYILTNTTTHSQRKSRIKTFVDAAQKAQIKQGV